MNYNYHTTKVQGMAADSPGRDKIREQMRNRLTTPSYSRYMLRKTRNRHRQNWRCFLIF